MTNGLRFIWAILAAFIGAALGIAAYVVIVISWVAIITSKDPRGMFDFITSVLRFSRRPSTYTLLMTDTSPKFE